MDLACEFRVDIRVTHTDRRYKITGRVRRVHGGNQFRRSIRVGGGRGRGRCARSRRPALATTRPHLPRAPRHLPPRVRLALARRVDGAATARLPGAATSASHAALERRLTVTERLRIDGAGRIFVSNSTIFIRPLERRSLTLIKCFRKNFGIR